VEIQNSSEVFLFPFVWLEISHSTRYFAKSFKRHCSVCVLLTFIFRQWLTGGIMNHNLAASGLMQIYPSIMSFV